MNKGEIKVLSGISASGKSTYANMLFLSDPNKYVIISRDKIRELLYGFTEESVEAYYSMDNFGKMEKQVTKYQNELIQFSLGQGKSIIIDNTNLRIKYIKEFSSNFDVPISFEFFDISLEEAIARDSKRVRKVGSEVITKQYENYCSLKKNFKESDFGKNIEPIFNNPDLPPCIVVDIDGTLAHKGDRSPFDWAKVGEDTIDKPTVNCVDLLTYQYKIIICSGRDGVCKEETKSWLTKNSIAYHRLLMRKANDCRKDYIIKEELWREIVKEYYIEFMLDDRQQVVNHARRLGFKVFQVEQNMF